MPDNSIADLFQGHVKVRQSISISWACTTKCHL